MAEKKRTLTIAMRLEDFMTKRLGVAGKGIVRFTRVAAGAFRRLARGIFNMKALIVGFVGVLIARKMFAALQGIAQELDFIGKTADRLNVTAESLQAIGFQAALAGFELPTLTAAMAVFSRNVEDAASGSIRKVEALALLGITLEDVKGKEIDFVEILAKIADGMNKFTRATELSAAMQQVFGRSGSLLIPILKTGGAAIRASRAEAEQLGILFSRKEVAKVEAYNDAWLRLTTVFQGFAQRIVIEVAPALTKFIDAIRLALLDNRGKIADTLKQFGKDFVDWGITILKVLAAVTDGLRIFFAGLKVGLKSAITSLAFINALYRGVVGRTEEQEKAYKKLQKEIAGTVVSVFSLVDASSKFGEIQAMLEGLIDRAKGLGQTIDKVGKKTTGGLGILGFDFLKLAEDSRKLGAFQKVIDDQARAGLRGQARIVAEIENRRQKDLATLAKTLALIGNNEEATVRYGQAVAAVNANYDKQLEEVQGGLFAGLKQGLADIKDRWGDFTTFGRNAITQLAQVGMDGLTNALTDWATGVKSAKEAFKQFGMDVLRLVAQMIIEFMILKAVQAGLGFFSPSPKATARRTIAKGGIVQGEMGPPFRAFQRGGIATQPTLALFGEGRQAEAFVPLPDGRSIPVVLEGGGARQVNLNFHITAFDSADVSRFLIDNRETVLTIYEDALQRENTTRNAVRSVKR